MKPALINPFLESIGASPLRQGLKLYDLLLRPEMSIDILEPHVDALHRAVMKFDPDRRDEIKEASEILIKYQGYIDREQLIAQKLKRLEDIKIKGKFNYADITSLSTEARQKLEKIQPETIGQASRIPGVSPSDINILLLLSGR